MKHLKKRNVQEELHSKYKDHIFVQLKDAKNVMDLKGLYNNILNLNIHNYGSQNLFIIIHNYKEINLKINDDFLLIILKNLE